MYNDVDIYNFLRVILDVIMLSILKTLFFGACKNYKKTRRFFLLTTMLLILLNILGIYRNSFTLWAYRDEMSYIWLGCDILQLIYCTIIYMIVFIREKLNKVSKYILFAFSFFFALLNLYNFLINFKWYDYEPFYVFCFWFINNLLMVLFCALISYILFSQKVKLRD